jgi:hypothetical protein
MTEMPKKDRKRIAFDISPEVKALIEEKSIELGVPQSQVAMLYLLFGLENYDLDRVELLRLGILRKSDSPAYQFTIDIDKARELFSSKK